MLHTFSNLSHDLILQVADLLLEEEDESAKNPWAPVTDRMSSGEQAIFNLSRTSTSLYKILSPYLFRCITLRNTEKCGQAVQYLCSTSQVANVKTLRFKCEEPGMKEEDLHDIESHFPNEVNDVLSNLSQFPHLATLIIDLGMDYFWDFANDVESEEEIEKAEEQKRWRALIKETLKAISTTCSDGVREFVLKQCPTRTNSVFRSEQFNKWLGKLESFKFEVHGRHLHSGRLIHTSPRFQSYIRNLDHYFFDAIANVTRLAIVGHHDGVIGQFFREALVPLKTTHVPKLKELELGYYIIQDDLLDFLVAHSSTLEHLIFNHSFLNCSQYPESEYKSQGTWKSWFHIYASEEPRALQCVTFIPYCYLSIKTRQVRGEQKAEEKEHRIFPYGMMKDGFNGIAREHITQRAREDDLAGWYELMAVINRNRERVKGDWILDASGDVSNVRHER